MTNTTRQTTEVLLLTILATLAMLGICWAAPGPPPTPIAPQGSLGGLIYAAVIVGVAVVGFWKMRK